MKKKNLLYIFADQWRAHAIGAAKEDYVLTPHMDAFVAESMAFNNAVSTYPLCSPHRASLFTGKYPYNCGMWTNCKIGLDEVVMLKPQEITISDVLHEAGYETAYIGKWHLDASELNFTGHPKSGAKDWDAFTPVGERRHHFDFWYSYGAMDNHLTPHYWKDSSDKVYGSKWSLEHETDVSIDYLKKREGEAPFCMFLSWNPPHPPYDLLPPEYRSLYEGQELLFRENVPEEWRDNPEYRRQFLDYYGAITGMDDNFGRLIAFLKKENLYEDTIIVLSADHGDCMGSHGLMGKNIWYEESIRIPFYIRGAEIKPGTSDVLFSSQDHMPTLLELLGEEIPESVQGLSFCESIQGKDMKNEPDSAFICMIPGMPEMVEAFRKLGLNHKAYGWRGVRTKDSTYIIDNGTKPDDTQRRILYENKKDRWQMDPIYLEAEDKRAIQYDKIMLEYLKKTGDAFLWHKH